MENFDELCYSCGTEILGPLNLVGQDRTGYGECPRCHKQSVTLFGIQDFEHMKVTAEGGSER